MTFPQQNNQQTIGQLMEAQQRMINNWVSMLQSSASHNLNKNTLKSLTEMWREAVQSGIRSMTMHTDPVIRSVAEKVFTSQLTMLRFIEVTSQIWSHILVSIHNGEDWSATLTQQIEHLRGQWIQAAHSNLHSVEGRQDQWQVFIDEGCAFSVFWPEALRKKVLEGHIANQPSAFLDMTSLHWEAYPESIGQFIYGPGTAELQAMQELLEQNFSTWLVMRQKTEDYHTLLINAWLDAYTTLMHDLARLAADGDAVESVRDFLNRWSATADKHFKGVLQSKAFVQAQANLINAVMQFRQHQQILNNHIMRLYGLPTRDEINEAHRRIYELRKEVKALKREMDALRQALQPKTDLT